MTPAQKLASHSIWLLVGGRMTAPLHHPVAEYTRHEIEEENTRLRADLAMRPGALVTLYAIREALGGNEYYGLSNLEGDVRTLVRQNAKLRAALEQCEDYFDGRADVVDGSYGVLAPNAEMSILSEIREALGRSA